MSWSFGAVGKPAALLEKARKDLGAIKCAEPEETIKTKCLNIIEASLLVFPPNTAVEVKAGGSQYCADSKKPNELVNSLSFEIKPIWGFVE